MIENNKIMQDLIAAFPSNLIEAVEISRNNPLKKTYPTFNNILICGLGGSGIGGKLVANWFANELEIPVNICQDYTIPNYVNTKTLVIACSYSGNTEETLAAAAASQKKGASIIAITSGGILAEFCVKNNYEYLLIPGGKPPRTQLGFSIVQLTHILSELNLIEKNTIDLFTEASNLLVKEELLIHQEAKKLAEFMDGKELIIYSDAKDEAIAIRARQQFNENAKILCSHHVIPEMNHNELVGWAGGREDHAVLFIHTGNIHPQNEKRFDFSKEVIGGKTENIYELNTNGNNMLLKSLYLINVIDWASLYLAEVIDVDPIEVRIIDKLKSSLI